MNNGYTRTKFSRDDFWRNFTDVNQSRISSDRLLKERSYFETGDLSDYLTDNDSAAIYIIVNHSPVKNIDEIRQTVIDYWHWLNEDPVNRGPAKAKVSLNEQFSEAIKAIFSDALDVDVAVDLFKWICGEKFEASRTINFSKEGSDYAIQVNMCPEQMCFLFIPYLCGYFWRPVEKNSEQIAIALSDYFLSAYEQCHESFFNVDFSEDVDVGNGKIVSSSWIKFNHWLLALLNGYTTDFDKYEGFVAGVCFDSASLSEFKNSVDTLKLPTSYEKLLEHIRSYKKDEVISLSGW